MKTREIKGKVYVQGHMGVSLLTNAEGVPVLIAERMGAELLRMNIGDGSDLIECLQAALKEAL